MHDILEVILKQTNYNPMNVIDQVMVLYAGTRGYLDKVPAKSVRAWEEQFRAFMKEQMPEVRSAIEKDKKISNDTEPKLVKAIETFTPQFKG